MTAALQSICISCSRHEETESVLRNQLVRERLVWAEKRKEFTEAGRAYMAAQSADNVTVRIAARERLIAALEAL